jgi:1-pyrroline-5-carboxylate dehydrogenase
VLLKAAELLATTQRATVNAATMLGQAKTAFQTEIDAACELIDFWRFNVSYAQELYHEQPISSAGVWNQLEYRPLEGFVYAVSPFNFTAIGGNLSTAPVLMGGVSIWKPASSAMLSAYYVMRVLEAAGMPPGSSTSCRAAPA